MNMLRKLLLIGWKSMNYGQIEKKQEKLKILIDAYREFKDNISSLREFSKMLGTGFSKSTIQRYFHEMYEQKMIDENEYAEICLWLKNNVREGNSLGGNVAQQKYGYEKDELGHFKGGNSHG